MFDDFYLYIYLKGYQGQQYPRVVRRIFAKTRLHRAWLAGFMGIFSELDSNGLVVKRSITGLFYPVNPSRR